MEWVKHHQDDDSPWNIIEELQSLKLLLNAKLNIWCDKMAGEACKQNVSQLEADVLPAEKWAVYCISSTPKKIVTHFNSAILTQLYRQPYNILLAIDHRERHCDDGEMKEFMMKYKNVHGHSDGVFTSLHCVEEEWSENLE